MQPIIFRISKSNKLLFLLLFCLGFMQSCRDFIAVDLRDKDLTVLSPSDNLTTTSATVNFYWMELDGARTYHLQIAKPSFDNMTTLLIDTSVTLTQFTYVFTPGTYQWRVRAENGSTQTPYITRSITIDSTADLTGQTLILFSPANDYATNDTTISFSYYGLYNASSYRFVLKTASTGFSGTQILPDQVVTDTVFTLSGLSEGHYDWGVRGESSLSTTTYAVRSIYIDYTNPGLVSLSVPASNATVIGPTINFSWLNSADSGSPLYDSVYVYSDTSMTNIRKALYINGTSVSDTLSIGTYYWRVRAIDKAGNKSAYTSKRKFIVN